MTDQLTWTELAACGKGARLRFVENWDIFPIVLIPAGTFATVRRNALNEMYHYLTALPDDQGISDRLEAWDGDIVLAPRDDVCEGWNDLSPVALV